MPLIPRSVRVMGRRRPRLRLYQFLLVVAAVVIVQCYWQFVPFPPITGFWENLTISPSVSAGFTGNVSQRCELPALDAFGPHIIGKYHTEHVDCGKKFLNETAFPGIAFTVENGHELHLKVNLTLLGLNCCFRTFARQDDMNNVYSHCAAISGSVTIIPTNVEFIEVLCSHGNPEEPPVKYHDAFALVQQEKLNTKETNFVEDDSRFYGKRSVSQLNVVVIGLDSTTRLNFLRQMPLSNDFLLRKLGAISLDGFSIIGINTHRNLLPLLTGLSFAEYTRTFGQGRHVDHGPYIWKEFAKLGYITSYAEDWGNFNKYWQQAFKEPPTTYYFRPYVNLMDTLLPSILDNPCFGPRLSVEVVLKYFSDVQRVAKEANRPYFQFGWTARMIHDNHYGLAPYDVPLLLYLHRFVDTGAFNNTALLLVGDHGSGLFNAEDDGRAEYKWPLAYIVLPPWFSNQFPEAYKNLKGNAKRMTVAFDLHATLEELLDLNRLNGPGEKKNGSSHGISLFRKIPPNRGCLQAGIALQWCHFCHPSIPLQENSALVQLALPEMVNRINQMVQGHSKCRPQTFYRLNKALKWDPRDVLLEICNLNAEDEVGYYSVNATRQLNISCDPENELVDVVEVQFQTNPIKATYNVQAVIIQKREVGLEKASADSEYESVKVFPMSEMARVDLYRETGRCVEPGLKPYCICPKSLYSFAF